MNLSLYDPFREMTFSRHACFLCGTIVSDVEQISAFPDWLQKRYGLAEKSLLLLDQSTTTFGKMQIPCCPACQQKIQEVENRVETAAGNGMEGWQNLDKKTLFLWLAKIFYGILTTELEAEKAPLIKPEHTVGENPKMLHKFQSFFMLLQALRLPIEFDDFTPSSIFIIPLNREENTPEFTTEKIFMQQVFTNLISNGIKYNNKSEGRIVILSREVGSDYEFSVTDNGPGIPPQYHDKIFGVFQTMETRDTIESTGVGLAIVKKIIEEKGGNIRVESKLNEFTSFIFTWPKIDRPRLI